MMAETDFFLSKQSEYDVFLHRLLDEYYDDRDVASEAAKLAFAHFHVVEKSRPIDELPPRIASMYKRNKGNAMKKWA